MFDTKIIEIENRRGAEKVQLSYVKYLYANAEVIKDTPDWENCFNVAVSDDLKIDDNLDIILNTVVGYLVNHNKIATNIAKTSNAIFIKME